MDLGQWYRSDISFSVYRCVERVCFLILGIASMPVVNARQAWRYSRNAIDTASYTFNTAALNNKIKKIILKVPFRFTQDAISEVTF